MTASPPATLIYPDSLGDTLDAIHAALFYEVPLPVEARLEAALWVAGRQGLPGSYAGMFAPTGYDYAFGALTFTGEPVRSGAATGHILSEEACRALYRLGAVTPEVRAAPEVQHALERARRGIMRRLADGEKLGVMSGVYCCGTCTVALWRHLSAGCQPGDDRRLEHGLNELKRSRDGKGRWRRFPFFYTLLALSELDHPAAQAEIDYTFPVIERAQRRLARAEPASLSEHERRRKWLVERVLGII